MAALLLLVLFALQDPSDRFVGLLRLPEVLGPDTCVPYTPKPINVFAAPAANTPRIGTIEVITPMQPQQDGGCISPVVRVKRLNNKMGELPTEEIGYEIPAAIVYERSGNWFRIGLDEGSGWIQVDASDTFTDYANLVIGDERPPHLENIWDGRLFSESDWFSPPIQLPNEWRSLLGKTISYVTVLESQIRGRELWFRIRLGTENACAEVPENLPKLEGWIPAYAGQKRVVWFSSRGC